MKVLLENVPTLCMFSLPKGFRKQLKDVDTFSEAGWSEARDQKSKHFYGQAFRQTIRTFFHNNNTPQTLIGHVFGPKNPFHIS